MKIEDLTVNGVRIGGAETKDEQEIRTVELPSGVTVTIVPADALGANLVSPEYFATTLYGPPPGRSLIVVPLKFPLASGSKPIPASVVPSATNDTSPVGVPPLPVTVPLAVTFVPCVIEVGVIESVVVVAVRATPPQPLTRFATFAEPSPVAGS